MRDSSRISKLINGAIIARGTEGKPIIFNL